jgi:hypothetical protein
VAIDGFQVAGEGVRQGQRGQTRWGDGEEKEGDRPPKAKPEIYHAPLRLTGQFHGLRPQRCC